jgi:hypothetical protein
LLFPNSEQAAGGSAGLIEAGYKSETNEGNSSAFVSATAGRGGLSEIAAGSPAPDTRARYLARIRT